MLAAQWLPVLLAVSSFQPDSSTASLGINSSTVSLDHTRHQYCESRAGPKAHVKVPLCTELANTTRFLYYELSEGLTNQALLIAQYHVLAAHMNRTLIIGPLRTGNNFFCARQKADNATKKDCAAAMPIQMVYDVRELAQRLPRSAPICLLGNASNLAALEALGEFRRFGPFLGDAAWPKRLPCTSDNVDKYVALRFAGDAARMPLIELKRNVGFDFIFGGSHPHAPQYYRAFFPSPMLLELACEIVGSIRASMQPGGRLVWAHLRVEADWNVKTAPGGGKYVNSVETLVSKLAHTVSDPQARAAIASRGPGACGSVPPRSADAVYLAGGELPDPNSKVGAVLAGLFSSIRTADQWQSVRAFTERTAEYGTVYQGQLGAPRSSLHPLRAALDFYVSLLADTLVLSEASTFSMNAFQLHEMGRGSQSEAIWTFGVNFGLEGEERGLIPLCGSSSNMLPSHMSFFSSLP